MSDSIARNLLLIRSVAFGLFTKLSGAVVLVIGVPFIAQTLPLGEYAQFLQWMGLAVLASSVFGSANRVLLREVASTQFVNNNRIETERELLGFYVFLFFVVLVISVFVSIVFGYSGATMLVLFVAAASGFFQQAEIYRIGVRSDHVSSLWVLISNLVLLGSIVIWGSGDLILISSLYFGVPAVFYFFIFVQFFLESGRALTPKFNFRLIRENFQSFGASFVYSVSEYVKIFASGLVVGALSGSGEYAKYTTFTLLVARIVNPLSLVTRPLLPAFMDAVHHGDGVWLGGVKKIAAILLVLGFVFAVALGVFIDDSIFVGVLGEDVGGIGSLGVICVSMFCFSHGVVALMSPFYFSSRGGSLVFSYVNAISVFVSVLFGFFLVFSYGAMGMLISVSIGSFISMAILYFFLHIRLFGNVNSAG